MPRSNSYPETVAECIDDSLRYRRGAIAAVRQLARARPWRGEALARRLKLQSCAIALAGVYGIEVPAVETGRRLPDCYLPGRGIVHLSPRLSVVTFLHEFAHHLEHCRRGRTTERFACRWSINLFKRCFPRSFARCIQVGHTLQRPDRHTSKAA